MIIRPIIVSPKYQINIGYIARISKNFGMNEIIFIAPRAKVLGKKAIMYSKHGRELLESARCFDSLKEIEGSFDLLIGSTGIAERGRIDIRRPLSPTEVLERIERMGKEGLRIGLVIGRDDTGLSADELDLCDIVVNIRADPKYPVLNISHALGIMLYELTKKELGKPEEDKGPDEKELLKLFGEFESSLDGKKIRNRKAVIAAFKRVVKFSKPSAKEVHALITAFKQ